jgi:hypothetical protein
MGLKEAGLRGSLRNVSVGASVIPDSVVSQYDIINDWSQGDGTVTDSVGSDDMSITGDIQDAAIGGETGGEGDGSDDYGQSGSQSIGTNQTFGVAFTFRLPSAQSATYAGLYGNALANRIIIYSGVSGQNGDIQFDISDTNENLLRVYTDATYADDTAHLCVINKGSNDANDIDIYVDDMSTPVSKTVSFNDAFDHTAFNPPVDMAFWARNKDGTIDEHMNITYGVWEFNSEPYTQSERDGLLSRRPEV